MTADGIPDLYVADQECYGIFAFLFEVLRGGSHVSEWSVISCVLWSSLIILFYSLLWRNRKFRQYVGARGILILYGVCIVQMFFPISSDRQKVIMIPQSFNPVILLFRKKLFTLGSLEISAVKLMFAVWIVGIVVRTVYYVSGHVKNGLRIQRLPKRRLDETGLPEGSCSLLPAGTKIYWCAGLSVPVSFGRLRGQILIPDRDYTVQELKYIIRHESVHLKFRDHITAFLTDILCAVYWWNPCIYILKRDIEQGMEIRCDQQAVCYMENQEIAEYMETLLTVFRNRYGEFAQSGLGMLGSGNALRRQMKQRFDMLESGQKRTTYGAGFGIMVASFAVALMILSNSMNLAPFFPPDVQNALPPGVDMGSGDNYYLADENSYFYRAADGDYILVNPMGERELPKEVAEVMIADGVPLKEKNGK